MNPLSKITVFKALPPDELSRLEREAVKIQAHNATEIFSQGDPADAVYAILNGDGYVRIGSGDSRGKRLMVELFRVGDIFGEIGVIDGGKRTAAAHVEGDVSLLKIRASTFLELLSHQPALGIAVCRALASRLRRTFLLMEDATFEALEVRLARQVLYLAEQGGRQTSEGTRVPGRFRQADLADLLGTTPRSIITILNRWRARKIILYDVKRAYMTVCDKPVLRELVGIGDVLREELKC
jgi:CRP-like cAMP-binding protein